MTQPNDVTAAEPKTIPVETVVSVLATFSKDMDELLSRSEISNRTEQDIELVKVVLEDVAAYLGVTEEVKRKLQRVEDGER